VLNETPLHEDVWVYLHEFLLSALVGSERSASHTGRFAPKEEASDTHLIGVCGQALACLEALVKRKRTLPQPGIEPRSYSP